MMDIDLRDNVHVNCRKSLYWNLSDTFLIKASVGSQVQFCLTICIAHYHVIKHVKFDHNHFPEAVLFRGIPLGCSYPLSKPYSF